MLPGAAVFGFRVCALRPSLVAGWCGAGVPGGGRPHPHAQLRHRGRGGPGGGGARLRAAAGAAARRALRAAEAGCALRNRRCHADCLEDRVARHGIQATCTRLLARRAGVIQGGDAGHSLCSVCRHIRVPSLPLLPLLLVLLLLPALPPILCATAHSSERDIHDVGMNVRAWWSGSCAAAHRLLAPPPPLEHQPFRAYHDSAPSSAAGCSHFNTCPVSCDVLGS